MADDLGAALQRIEEHIQQKRLCKRFGFDWGTQYQRIFATLKPNYKKDLRQWL